MEQRGIGEEGLQELLEMVLFNYQKKEWNSDLTKKVQLKVIQWAQLNESYDPGIDDPIIEKLVKAAAFGLKSKKNEVVEQEELLAEYRVTDDHLKKFEKGTIDKNTEANVVNVQFKIDQVVKSVVQGEESKSLTDEMIDSEMSCPDGSTDTVVIHTQNDGEVPMLARALKIIARYFANCSGNKNVSFTVSLYGAWGACDGCKKRIERFVELWFGEARKVMKLGKTATLKVTYQYLNVATVMHQTYGDNLYGWEEDPGKKGPWFHTLEASVTGS
jgi:hypothetical protein